ncbi:NAD(P)-binding domain-containing protein [Pseudoflavitalea sp. X16]|uniref:NADPH-dependent F420 reductase n=1 Tax=Paraflavitalea devenefica TaxID=2716334 RepID=UPI001422F3A9|nr:NAD(P)-binding domain-containing protein [Paraflavitalea devenefica]NII29197.1 NAD(P)-binding domain-containing protein [Paraflavitalea devenefica]
MSNATNKAKVAVIGLGNIGTAVVTNLVKGNRPVIIAGHQPEQAKVLAQKLGNLVQPMEVQAAIKEADIIVFAVWFNVIKELLGKYATELQGKIIVDPSNPIAPDDKGGFVKIIGEKESAGQVLSALLPKGAKLAKALGTLGVASLANAAYKKPVPAVLFYATDDTGINGAIEQLIHDSGFEPVRVGGIDQSIRIEVFGDLHEFGALGKVVTAVEAKEKV